MTGAVRCPACKRSVGSSARFCRRCGAALVPVAASPEDDGDAGASGAASLTTSSVAPAIDEQRVFRQLCWMGGLLIVISVLYAISVRAGGPSAVGALVVLAAVSALAAGAALGNPGLVRDALSLPRADGIAATLAVALVLAPTLTGAFWLLEQLGFPLVSGYLAPYVDDGFPAWMGYADVALVTPIAEELLFRGVIQPKLGQIIKPKEALVVQAALFSAMHLSPVILITHFAMGLGLGWLRAYSGSLLPGIALHAAWNAWVVWSGG